MKYTVPHEKNFCGGNFQDWIEVMLESRCNGKCSFCIEKDGFRPKEKVSWLTLTEAIVKTGKTNILLLGGEPTLYPRLEELIRYLVNNDRKVFITTNGGKLMANKFIEKLAYVDGINISIHHYDLDINEKITGVKLNAGKLKSVIAFLHSNGAKVRINCNCIAGYIDSKEEIFKFIEATKEWGANSVRFAELKFDDRFVDLNKIFDGEYGLNDDPFIKGCHQNATINGMHVNFRQLCGMQSDKRPLIKNPKQILKDVLYYDGKVYHGWQKPREKYELEKASFLHGAKAMTDKEIKEMKKLLERFKKGDASKEYVVGYIMGKIGSAKADAEAKAEAFKAASESAGSGCVY